MEIINTKEAARLVKSTVRTMQRNADAGIYPEGVCGKHGHFWLFNKDKLLEFVFNNPQIA